MSRGVELKRAALNLQVYPRKKTFARRRLPALFNLIDAIYEKSFADN